MRVIDLRIVVADDTELEDALSAAVIAHAPLEGYGFDIKGPTSGDNFVLPDRSDERYDEAYTHLKYGPRNECRCHHDAPAPGAPVMCPIHGIGD